MNYPGSAENNWAWRYYHGQLHRGHADRLGDLTAMYGRAPVRTETG
jgi:4-alpha-glucanotransferase